MVIIIVLAHLTVLDIEFAAMMYSPSRAHTLKAFLNYCPAVLVPHVFQSRFELSNQTKRMGVFYRNCQELHFQPSTLKNGVL